MGKMEKKLSEVMLNDMGKRFRHERKLCLYSLSMVSDMMGHPIGTVSAIEKGNKHMSGCKYGLSFLIDCAKFYGVNINKIFSKYSFLSLNDINNDMSTDRITKIFINNILSITIAKGYTIEYITQRLGINKLIYINMIKNDKISFDILAQLLVILNLDFNDMFDEE